MHQRQRASPEAALGVRRGRLPVSLGAAEALISLAPPSSRGRDYADARALERAREIRAQIGDPRLIETTWLLKQLTE